MKTKERLIQKKKAIEDGIKNGEVLGAEALVRWIKEDNKIIPPSEFIDFAEREGLIKRFLGSGGVCL